MSARDQRYPTFSWWQGIVEDRNDPAYAGRYRVRIYGHHTQSKEKLPTAHLPWAIPMQPVTSAAISGVGQSPTGLVEGSAVIGFFVDGDEGQIPVIMGSFGVTTFMPKEGDDGTVIDPDRSQFGFNDPNYLFPKRKFSGTRGEAGVGPNHATGRPRTPGSSPNWDGQWSEEGDDIGENILEEPDMSRLARNRGDKKKAEEHYSTIAKRDTRIGKDDKGIPIAYAAAASSADIPYGFRHPDDGSGEQLEINDPRYKPAHWKEPHPQGAEESASEYPYNHVWETESGHVFEVDDTAGAERIHEYHKSGTFYEVQPNGDKVTKIKGNGFEIDMKNKMIYVGGDYSMTVDGDYYLNVKGNKIEHISGHAFQTVRGSRHSKVQGDEAVDVESNMKHHILKNYSVQVGSADPNACMKPANFAMRVTGEYNLRVKDKMKTFAVNGRKDVTFGNHKINVFPKFELNFSEMAKTGAATIDSVLSQKSKLELFAQQDVSIGTGQIYPDPFFPTSPVPSISLATARYNMSCTADAYEKIGPTASFTGAASILLKPGFKTTQASLGINNIQGVDTGTFSLIPGIQNFVLAGGIVNNVLAGGIISNVTLGGITSNVTAGGIIDNVTAGGISRTVTAGNLSETIVVGNIQRTATAGGITDTAGTYVSINAGGAATMTAVGAAAVTGGTTATITATAGLAKLAGANATVTGAATQIIGTTSIALV